MKTLHLSLLCALGLAACSTQPDSEYQGEPLATLTGSIRSEIGAAPAEAALLWLNADDAADPVWWTTAAVTGAFPASFVLEVFTPPPAAVITDVFGLPRMASANIGVIKQGSQFTDADAVLGSNAGYELLYLEGDIEPGSEMAAMFGVLSAGYHLIKVTYAPTEADRQQCVASMIESGCSAASAQTECSSNEYGVSTFDEAAPATSLTVTLRAHCWE